MKAKGADFYHKIYGTRQPRAVYYKRDFVDYTLMILLCAALIVFSYKTSVVLAVSGLALCAFMLASFLVRHGAAWSVPVVARKPQELFYLFLYKLGNLRPAYFAALGLLLFENLLIAATPNLPHHTQLMRTAGLWLFYIHFVAITGFRTAVAVDHLRKRKLVREILMQTSWKRAVKENTSITFEITHAYCTGVLTHLLLIAPWYLVIVYARFSVLFLPLTLLLNVAIHLRWLKLFNSWFYRDHWLGHNSELEFVYLHGAHHDAIPSGMIAVAENGFLEGFLRSTIGATIPFYHPLLSSLVYTFEIKSDMELHQYIPGIYPRLPRKQMEVAQHSTHHYGPLEPYSLASSVDRSDSAEFRKSMEWVPDELRNSIRLDEELTQFRWDNPIHRKTLSLWDKYQDEPKRIPASNAPAPPVEETSPVVGLHPDAAFHGEQ